MVMVASEQRRRGLARRLLHRCIDDIRAAGLVPVLDTDGATTRRFGVLSLPSTFFIDRDGLIRHVELGGPLSDAQIRQGLAKAR